MGYLLRLYLLQSIIFKGMLVVQKISKGTNVLCTKSKHQKYYNINKLLQRE